ncbi:MAG: Rieske (2Fe-2S) protein, partial [Mucilaginibacter sp.]
MERSEFLAKFGIGIVAVCTGCSLASCGSKGSNPTPSNPVVTPPAGGGGNLLAVDLRSELINIGDSKIGGGVILVRLAADDLASSFIAVQSA